MFIEYASDKDICNALSPYKVGDKVVLMNNIQTAKGLFTKGTEMTVSEIGLRAEKPKIRIDELDEYSYAGEQAFRYTLELDDKKCDCYETDICGIDSKRITVNWLISDFERKAQNVAGILTILFAFATIFSLILYIQEKAGFIFTIIFIPFIIASSYVVFNTISKETCVICRKSEIKSHTFIDRERFD